MSASRAFAFPVIAGIWPLTSLRNAEFMKNDLRVSMPEEIMLRMAQADTPDARARRRESRLRRRCWMRRARWSRACRSARLLDVIPAL